VLLGAAAVAGVAVGIAAAQAPVPAWLVGRDGKPYMPFSVAIGLLGVLAAWKVLKGQLRQYVLAASVGAAGYGLAQRTAPKLARLLGGTAAPSSTAFPRQRRLRLLANQRTTAGAGATTNYANQVADSGLIR